MTQPAAVLFDMDGVLVDTRAVWFAVMNRTARALGCTPLDEHAFVRTFGQCLQRDVAQFYPGCTAERVQAHYQEFFAESAGDVQAGKGAGATLAGMRARGIRSAVVTNTARPLAQFLLRAAGLEVELLCTPDPLPPKPAPDLLRAALATLSAPPEAAWFVGDSANDREAAYAAGVRFVPFGPTLAGAIDDLTILLSHECAQEC